MKKLVATTLLILISTIVNFAQFGSQSSGGVLSAEQAAYDVKYYDLNFSIYPDEQKIDASAIVELITVKNLNKIVLDLDSRYKISSINLPGKLDSTLEFNHTDGKIFINLPNEVLSKEKVKVKIDYSGKPRVAQRPPWDDGFVWEKTADGEHWVGVTCQGGGADIWWPCKDHPSDEADSVSLSYTVPENLVCVSNGVLHETKNNNDGTVTYKWFSSNPINNYGISFNLAPYKTIEYEYTSVTGQDIPVTIWVLPESLEKAKAHCPQYLDHLRFFEELCGPYPFRNEKYGVAETSYLGMEHQTIIANGLGYKNNEEGFDWLHHHELAHEWWGNMVTAKDWSDFWIHEAIGGYMQALYTEKLNGKESYLSYISEWKNFENKKPIAKRAELNTDEAYFPDMYKKGAWALHTFRYYLGEKTFFKVLRRWAYPTPEMEKLTDGSQCRFADTDEFLKIAEDISGKKLDWFFEVYFRQASLPKLKTVQVENTLMLNWITENNIKFELPVEIKIDGNIVKVEMASNEGHLDMQEDAEFVIDPNSWLLMEIIEQ